MPNHRSAFMAAAAVLLAASSFFLGFVPRAEGQFGRKFKLPSLPGFKAPTIQPRLPPPMQPVGRFCLRTHNGKNFVTALPEGRVVSGPHCREWETFTVEGSLQPGAEVALKSAHGVYLTALPDGGLNFAPHRQAWETFRIERRDLPKTRFLSGSGAIRAGDPVTLRSHHGKYLVAFEGGGKQIAAGSPKGAQWETFTLIVPGSAEPPPARVVEAAQPEDTFKAKMTAGSYFTGEELAKLDRSTFKQCFLSCSDNPLCTGLTFDSGASSCKLGKGRGVLVPGAVSSIHGWAGRAEEFEKAERQRLEQAKLEAERRYQAAQGDGCAASGMEKQGLLCYEKCKEGYYGLLSTCWQRCPSGYTDIGALCHRDAHIYGKSWLGCAGGYRTDPVTCHRDMHTYGKKATGGCNPGYRTDPLTCHRDVHIYGKGWKCSGGCDSGYTNDGCTCRRNAHTYSRPLESCAPGYQDHGLVCTRPPHTYGRPAVPCNPGYRDDGLTCHRPLSSIAKHSYTRGSRPEKDILGALKDVADKMKRAYEKARDFAADALEKARAFVSEVASKVADYAKQGFSAMVQGLKKAWDAFAGGMEWLRDKIVEVATKTVAGAIMPLMRMLKVPVSARDVDLGTRLAFRRMLEDPGTGKLDPLRLATASRRDSAPQCASFLGFDAIENKLQGAIAAALPVVGSFASDSVKEALKTAADKAAAQSLEKAQASLQSQGAMAAVSSIGTQPALWELIKQNATATATFKAVGIKLLLHVATFPVGYTTAYFGCYAEWKRSRKEFEDCYEREFVDRFAKNWLFDFFVNVPLAALEHILITPLTLKITISVTTAVTTALAAMSAGVGATMAPAVAFLTAFLTKVGIMTGIQLAIRMSPILPGGRTFFDLYSDTTWKGASSFFRSLIGKSARMFYCGTHDRQGASFRAPADETKPQEQKWHTRCGGKGVWPPGKRSADGGIHNPGGCPEVAFAVGDRRLECIDERYALYYTPDPPGSGAKSVAAAIATARLTAAPPPPPPAATFAKAPPSAPPRPAVRTEPAPAGINVASGKPAKQSSTAYGGDPRRAVDGNPSGQWGANSVTHTDLQTSPWWEVDLGAPHAIDEIRVYNRTDCCGDRLTKFLVGVSSAPGGPGWTYRHPGKADARTVVPVRQKGRYVRIWLPGKSHLSLAEVEVMGKPDTAVAAPASLQYGWLWCNKCQALAYSLAGPGACPAGGSHQSSGSFLYGVQHSASGGGGQRDWRWCNKCQVLAFAGVGARPCAARGKHDFKGAAATTSCSPRIRRPGPSGTGAGATSARSWRSPGIRRQPVRREGSTRAVAPTTS